MDKPLLQLENVSTGYGIIPVLDGINLSVHKGDIYALLGPNGGGKSTLLKVCSRQIDPWTGSVKVAGRLTDGILAEDLAKAGVCTIPEGKGIFPNLTVDENPNYDDACKPKSRGNTISNIQAFPTVR